MVRFFGAPVCEKCRKHGLELPERKEYRGKMLLKWYQPAREVADRPFVPAKLFFQCDYCGECAVASFTEARD